MDTADIPGGAQLYLVRREDEYEILFGNEQLMGSWASESEQALATLVCERLGRRAGRVLIGGLGMGFTLGAALRALPPKAAIVVAEIVPKVVTWAKGPLAAIFGDNLNDPRVSLLVRDVHDVIVEQRSWFDAILLDVDNGPDGLIDVANERLYCNWGLRAAHAALRPGGILGVWSAHTDAEFVTRLQLAKFDVEEIVVAAGGGKPDRHHIIWIASRTD